MGNRLLSQRHLPEWGEVQRQLPRDSSDTSSRYLARMKRIDQGQCYRSAKMLPAAGDRVMSLAGRRSDDEELMS